MNGDSIGGKTEIEQTVQRLLEGPVTHMGYEIVDVRYLRGPQGMVLRLVIDKPGGVTIDDCAEVSRFAGDLLDARDPIEGSYSLEVSSPGINRPLKKEADFERFKGEKVYIQTREIVHERRRFRGILIGIEGGFVSVDVNGEIFEIPLREISKARLDVL